MPKTVNIEIHGTEEVQKMLKDKDKQITDAVLQELLRQGFFIEGEVKLSIAGQRNEPRSVDTGRFLNSVHTDQKQDGSVIIAPAVEYSNVLEFGTSTRKGRYHFRNTAARNKNKVQDAIKAKIIQVTKL